MRRILYLATILACAVGLTPALHAQTPPVPNRPDVSATSMSINSSGDDDFAPSALRGGEILVFTSSRSGSQRLWRTVRSTGGWSAPMSEGDALNHAEQLGAATLTPDGTQMIFAAYEWDGDDADHAQGRTDLYSAELVGGVWSNIKNLGPDVNSSSWESQPSLSTDGHLLFFASDRPGGSGGTDIYVSQRTASGWSRPTNVGQPVNTPMDEMSPSIAPDGKSLFFSSNGHGGAGGFDLFVVTGGNERGTNWGSLTNMGTPINSASNEYYFISLANAKNGYFTSDRAGDLDIYVAYPNPFPPDAMVSVSGVVTDATTKKPVAAKIIVTDLNSGEVVATYNTDDRTGDYYVLLARGHRYSITASAPDYIFYSDEYSVPPNAEGRDVKKNIDLYRAGNGTVRLLVYFDYNKSDLRPESKPELNRVVEFFKSHQEIKAEIAGHTDSLGSSQYNKTLSQNRADAVRQYLIEQGVDGKRLVAIGYGEDAPIDDNGTDEGRARNRRVEMRVKE
ncbi:MAG: OmpA family protein [Bacteroidetes bacterium]|nr:OmpA family protein [Bacteroidota bacterium]